MQFRLQEIFPVYDDAAAIHTVSKKAPGIAGIRVLLSSWDEPR